MWTLHAGDVWVACTHFCISDQADLFGYSSPPVRALCSEAEGVMELSGEEGVVPLEGGATRVLEGRTSEPPVGWLSSMWEGEVNDG